MSVSFSDIIMRRCTNPLCGYNIFMVAPASRRGMDICPQCAARLIGADPTDMREALDHKKHEPNHLDALHLEANLTPAG